MGLALQRLAPSYQYFSHDELDVTDEMEVHQTLKGARTIVHLGAMTNVDSCEINPKRAHLVNAQGTGNVISIARANDARIIYVSTDYVFAGNKRTPYKEDDTPRPLNVYGKSKLLGELMVAEGAQNLVLRTSWVFGSGRNFVRTIVGAAASKREVQVVDDQIGRPTHSHDVAQAIEVALLAGITGYLHVAGDGEPCSWADLATEALAIAGISTPLRRVSSDEYETISSRRIAPRPRYSVLSIERARRAGVPLRRWQDSLKTYVQEEL